MLLSVEATSEKNQLIVIQIYYSFAFYDFENFVIVKEKRIKTNAQRFTRTKQNHEIFISRNNGPKTERFNFK